MTIKLYLRSKTALFLLLSAALYGCISPHQVYTKISPGMWRGVLLLDGEVHLPGDKKEIVMGSEAIGELPFNFEVVYDDSSNFHIIIHNGTERIKVDDVLFGRDKQTAKDTLIINFSEYDSYIKVLVEETVMEGYFVVNYRDNYKIKFKANQGRVDRFRQTSNKAPSSFEGRYQVTFSKGTQDEYPAIGDFKQIDSRLTGTFLTETGDYRYLEGKVVDNKAYLSCFDGAHAYLFEMKKEGNEIIGEFRSGRHHREPFEGRLDNKSALTDGFDLVKKTSDVPLHFVLPNEAGQLFDTNNSDYNGKVKIYEIMGTWCPNCMDATHFLKTIENKYPEVKITALAFERYRDSTKALTILQKYKSKTQLPYPVLLAGYYDKKEASSIIPQIEKIKAYPTLLLVDQSNRLRKIYTGFYGPATKEHETFKKSFLSALETIINE